MPQFALSHTHCVPGRDADTAAANENNPQFDCGIIYEPKENRTPDPTLPV